MIQNFVNKCLHFFRTGKCQEYCFCLVFLFAFFLFFLFFFYFYSLLFETSFLRLENNIPGSTSANPYWELSGVFKIPFSFCAKKQKRTDFRDFFKFSVIDIR